MDLFEGLAEIQDILVAPKGQWNDFSSFNYRSCEDILTAVKPLLKERGILLTMSDELVMVGERYYVKSTCTIRSGDQILSSSANAREAEQKKGMDSGQLSGATSSYSRKYALGGMFLVDDGKDLDSLKPSEQGNKSKPSNNQKKDDKPWYNDFEKQKDKMIGAIATGERTADQIVANLRKDFKVSSKVADQIKGLK